MNLYFELSPYSNNKHLNVVFYNIGVNAMLPNDYKQFGQMLQMATRVWQQDAHGVSFAKNRNGPLDKVDMQEFLLVVLKSVPL